MEFLVEYTPPDMVVSEFLEEAADKGAYITGPFISYKKNRNGRVYERELMLEEIERFNREMIATRRSFGELDHPNSVNINPDRVSHLIVELRDTGEYAVGKAKILNTPCGQIARELLREGTLGISTRGVGKVDSKGVVNSFRLICVDLVMNPSGLECFVEMINENYEFILDDEDKIRQIEKKKKKANPDEYRRVLVDVFRDAFGRLKTA